jgi:hypothetical protein
MIDSFESGNAVVLDERVRLCRPAVAGNGLLGLSAMARSASVAD